MTMLTGPFVGISMEHWLAGCSLNSFQEALAKSRELGYTAMTVPVKVPSRLTTADLLRMRRAAEEAQVKLLVEYKPGYQEELEGIYHHDEKIVQSALNCLLEGLEITEKLGANYMGGCLYSERWQYEERRVVGHDAEDYDDKCKEKHRRVENSYKNCAKALKTLAELAQNNGIRIGVQKQGPMWHYDFPRKGYPNI